MTILGFLDKHANGIGFGFFLFVMLCIFTLLAAIASRPDAEMNACVKKPDHDWVIVKIDNKLEHECVVHEHLPTPSPSATVVPSSTR